MKGRPQKHRQVTANGRAFLECYKHLADNMYQMDDIFLDGDREVLPLNYPMPEEPQADPLDQFLNQDFLNHNPRLDYPTPNSKALVRPFLSETGSEVNSQGETQGPSRQKSPFHNFQKHLITVIKRTTRIEGSHEESSVVNQLWNAFRKTRSFNKKVLHMVFGVAEIDGNI